MDPIIVKGKLESCQCVAKYDDDGNEYRQYTFRINNNTYNAKTPRDLYLSDAMVLVLATDPKNPSQVLSGYSIKDGSHWGGSESLLKKQFSKEEAYEYVEGPVIEKRKLSSRTYNYSDKSYENSIAYTVVLEDKTFRASDHLGEWLKPGMQIAVVLQDDSAYLVQDRSSGKIRGLGKPYFVLFIAAMILFTATMMYYHAKDPALFPNYSVSLTVINIFLFLAALLNIKIYSVTQRMKKFLEQKQRLIK